MKEKVKNIISILKKEFPDAKCELIFFTSHQLLVATILSAQCTDKRVNIVTKSLFQKYKSIEDFANVFQKKLEEEIFSTGFYHNKAKSIIAMSKMILEKFNGNVPNKMEDLLLLSGVGRKTANVVLGNAFNKNCGIVVDTHVSRLSQRIGFTKNKTPEKIEIDLMEIVPKKYWTIFSHWLISHGRKTCFSRNPKCDICFLKKNCNYYKKIKNEN